MSAVSEPQNSPWVEPDQYIRIQLDQARSRIRTTDVLTATVLAGLLLVGYVLVFTLLDHWVIPGGFRPLTRAVLLFTIVASCAGILLWFVIRRLGQSVHPVFAARMLERSQQSEDGSLLSLVDLQAHGREPGIAIRKTLEKRAAVRLAAVHIDEVVDRRWLMRLSLILFVMTLLTCLYAVLSPKSISLLRPFSFARAAVSTRTVLESIQPGNAAVPAGTQVQFQVDVSGTLPDSVQVLYTTSDRRFVDEPLKMQPGQDQQRFTAVLTGEANRGVRQNLQYHIVAGDAVSDTFNITVIQPPTATVTSVRYQHPEYMQLPDRTEQAGAIATWQDTTVTITAETTAPVSTALLQFSDDATFSNKAEEAAMSISETTLTGKWKLEERSDKSFPKYYRVFVEDSEGRSDPEPPVYPIQVRRDERPVVRVLDPARDLEVPANAIVPLLAEAEDPDFLLRNVTLHYSVNGQPRQPAEFLMDSAASGFVKSWRGTYDFKLSLLRLKPGDTVTWHLEARDNRPPLGNQGSSGELNLRIAAPVADNEVQQQLQQDRQMQQQQLQQKQAQEQREQQQPQGQQPAEPQTPQPGQDQQPRQDGQAAQQPQPGQSGGQSTAVNGQPAKENNAPQPQQPGDGQQQTAAGDSGKTDAGGQSAADRKIDDDEALKKLLDSMQRKQDPNSQSRQPDTDREAPVDRNAANNTDGNKTEGSKAEDNRTEDNKTEDNKTEGNKTEGNNAEGNKAEGSKADGSKTEGNNAEGNKAEGSKAEGSDTEGSMTNGKGSDGSPADGGNTAEGASEPGKSSAGKSGEQNSASQSQAGQKSERGKSGKAEGQANGSSGGAAEGSGNPDAEAGQNKSGQSPGKQGSQSKSRQASEGTKERQAGEGQQDGGNPQGGSESGNGQQGDQPPGESETASGDSPKTDQPSDRQQPAGQKSGEKSGGQQSGGQQSGNAEAGGKSGNKSQGGGQQPGGGGQGPTGQPGASGGVHTGGGNPSSDTADGPRKSGAAGTGRRQPGAGQGPDDNPGPVDPAAAGPAESQNDSAQERKTEVDEAAQAAGLALKRLQKDLERGEVDPELLKELGWTKDELAKFADRMQQQLDEREQNEQQQREKSLSQKSFEEMLRSLGIGGSGAAREGDARRDRERQDTTIRNSAPPSRYRSSYEAYRRSLSTGRPGTNAAPGSR
ncbi:MAG: hypothetical protein ACK56U_14815 [Planctomyces sp.]